MGGTSAERTNSFLLSRPKLCEDNRCQHFKFQSLVGFDILRTIIVSSVRYVRTKSPITPTRAILVYYDTYF